jgi:CDP-glucose 4,6-dehydratase
MTWQPDRSFWHGRHVAVTGATGFLGGHLVAMLCDMGAQVVVVVRDDITLSDIHQHWWSRVANVRGDVRDQETLERVLAESKAQTVLHLAAQSQVGVANTNPVLTFDSNIRGTWSLLEAVRLSPLVTETVLASSDKAYGRQSALPYDEDMALRAVDPYDVSKAAGDMIACSYAHSFGVKVAVNRSGNFYGPGDTNWSRLIPGTIRTLLKGRPPVIRSDGSMIRDYLYVADGAASHLQLAEGLASGAVEPGDVFNFSAERPLTVLEVVDLIQKSVGTSFTPDIEATAAGENPQQYLSAAKARAKLGWEPRFTFEEGLEQTVGWYRAALSA